MNALLPQFSPNFVEVESPYGSTLDNRTIVLLLEAVAARSRPLEGISLHDFATLALHYLKISNLQGSQEESTICFCLSEFMRLGGARHEEITGELVKENQHLIALV